MQAAAQGCLCRPAHGTAAGLLWLAPGARNRYELRLRNQPCPELTPRSPLCHALPALSLALQAISRSRFWGTPLPIWISEDLEEVVVVGSVAQLEELTGEKVRGDRGVLFCQRRWPGFAWFSLRGDM